jgi:putative S-layer y domain protein
MVAKAMAKTETLSTRDQQLVRRLSAEFSDELNNLGARVDNLERNADKVKWTGETRYTYTSERHKNTANKNNNELSIRLEPTAEINENISIKSRLNAYLESSNDTSDEVKLNRLFAEGQWNNLNVKAGKVPTQDNTGVILDNDNDSFPGAVVTYGKDLQVIAGGGRWSSTRDIYSSSLKRYESVRGFDNTVNYWFSGFGYDNGKLSLGGTYHHIAGDDLKVKSSTGNNPYMDLVGVNAGYKFNKDFSASGSYARNYNANEQNKAGAFQLNYKGATPNDVGSWGLYTAYRYLGNNTSFHNGFEVMNAGQRGYEIGGNYTVFQNTVASLRYFDGVDINRPSDQNNAKAVFGRVQFLF